MHVNSPWMAVMTMKHIIFTCHRHVALESLYSITPFAVVKKQAGHLSVRHACKGNEATD